jgi:hypothetical protein
MGALKTIRHRSSQNYRVGKPGQPLCLTEVYIVTWVPTGTETMASYPGDGAVIASASNAVTTTYPVRVPKVQERYPGCDPNLMWLVVESVDWKPNTQAQYSWTVTVEWESRLEFIYSDATAEPLPWTRITRTCKLRQMQAWRLNADIPATIASYTWPPTTDIGGTKVDIHGAPIVRQVPQQEIVCEWYYDRTFSVDENDEPAPEPSALITGWLGIRNAEKFLGIDKGYVVCTGISLSPVNNQTYIAQARFLFDWLGHYEQRCAPNTGGANFLTQTTNFIGVPNMQASKVGWFQPYYDALDITKIFPEKVYQAFTTALPAYNTSCAVGGRNLTGRNPDFTQYPGAS